MGFFNKFVALFGKRKARDFEQSSVLEDAPSGWALPPLNSRDAEAILTESEYAALEATPDDGERLNPHPPGTRAHRLWAENFAAVQALKKKR